MSTTKQVISITAHKINTEYRKSKSLAIDSVNHYLTCGLMLADKKKELGHGNFIPWINAECDFGESAARKMMATSKRYLATDLTEDDAIAISRDMWGHKDVIALKHTGDHESYTPPKYIEASREVMGSIDVDPASNPFAQQVVKAEKYYTAEDDGLSQEWSGCVFLNPPYEHPLIEQFIDKLITDYKSGSVKQAILLTNNSADTQWFHKAASASELICLTEGRINFMKADGTTSSPTNGQAFFYFGGNGQRFIDKYSEFGLVLRVL